MSLRLLQEADLSAPYWQPWQQWFNPVPNLALEPTGQVAEYLNRLKPDTLAKRFVPQDDLPSAMAYESYIAVEDRIPTRDGLHDFFNGLCWFAFPHTKAHFNQLHQEQIARLGTQARGRIRDMLTVLDENGFLIQAPDPLWEALQAKQWYNAFVQLRPLWQDTRVMVFGHALLEKLVSPYKAITAHALRIPNDIKLYSQQDERPQSKISGALIDAGTLSTEASCRETRESLTQESTQIFQRQDLSILDDFLREYLSQERLLTKPYIPIQIFGIPGWSKEQEQANFYEDKQVFRPPRTSAKTIQA
ncbi:MAG: DUF3025 domain-containing protein [Pelistega sp.]|nr:DUF3025 domain-containing protein [Pelistega sp.]